ncbi:acylneuraminate cytidylyltransferase family protein [Gandjariella thermophila]|uniref:Putative N-acylneuraminate cytidylyltransferase n=1 Tax=Gandjariella thermophila TaxID=1931992 RepID=A0A4D4JIE5_9PSEU|nr:acylneuraminate cytidylyltransferase family protein [Gandjariella thermophila]GDY33667.1 putative N-acylneuraminate cytidylyltransferase [Gandjariella thermophila]
MITQQVLAVVPARGDSRSFPGKNLAPFLGRPLVAHTVATAAAAGGVHRVVVTTDDDRIAAVAAGAGADVVRRPTELATATSRTVDGVLHALGTLGVDDRTVVVLVQPTSPLRTPADIDECLDRYPGHGSVVQVTAAESGHHPWKACLLVDGTLRPCHDWADLESPRQLLPAVLRPTGGVYVLRAADLARHRRFFVPEVLPQRVPEDRAVDIDTAADLHLAEQRARALGWSEHHPHGPARPRPVAVAAFSSGTARANSRNREPS